MSGSSSLNAASSSSSSSFSSSSSSSPQSGWIAVVAAFCAWSLSLFFNPRLAGGPTPFRPGRVGLGAGALALPLPPPPPFALPPPRFVAAPIVVRDRIVAGRRAHPWSGPANPPRAAENASVAAVTRCDAPIDAGICGEARVSDDATGPGAVPTRAGARSRRDVVSMVAPLLSQLMHVRGRASSNAECRRPRLSRCAFFLRLDRPIF